MPEQSLPNTASNTVIESQADRQPEEKKRLSAGRIIATVVALVLMLCLALWSMYSLRPSDPYIQSVLQLTGDTERGHDIFQLNCATCHGLTANGEVGPDLNGVSERKSRVALIRQVISGQTPPMPQFQPNERDMADLLAFLETL